MWNTRAAAALTTRLSSISMHNFDREGLNILYLLHGFLMESNIRLLHFFRPAASDITSGKADSPRMSSVKLRKQKLVMYPCENG
jgi:hypothetical protein